MITIVTWTWRGERIYLPSYVNTLRSMFERHLNVPHKLFCITDDTDGFDSRIELLKTPESAQRLAHMKSPEGGAMPSCYRRLWLFSDEAKCLGDRILLTDVDAVITGNITHLVQRDESFVGWRPRSRWGNHDRVAGGLYLMTPGCHPEVWYEFCSAGIEAARSAGYRGSDQAWLSYMLGKKAALWTDLDGIYALSDMSRGRAQLPKDAKMVQFAGLPKPWECIGRPGMHWVAEHYK